MTDQLVRTAFHRSVLHPDHQCQNTFVINELGLKNGDFRADIAVLNGKMIGYEIKTAKDNLSRLPSQVEAYCQIFHEVFLVVAEKHLKNALALVPGWWGIYLIRPVCQETFYFECVRESQSNKKQDSFSIAQLLWKDEALEIANTIFNCNIKSRTTKHKIYTAISTACPANTLGGIVIEYLKKREAWRKDRKGLWQNGDYCLPSSKHSVHQAPLLHAHI